MPDQKVKKGHMKELLRNITVMLILMGIATISAALFFRYSENSTSVAIIYVLAVMLVAKYTTGYVPGIVASLIGVVCVNYVFTFPYMNLDFTLDGYPVTFLGMTVVSAVTSALTTTTKRQNEILRKNEKLIMEAEKETMRANLLRAVSHDLRTPLTSIIGMAQAYEENAEILTNKEKMEMVKNIREDAGWLLNMVENLLSVTRIRMEDTKVNTSLELLEEVVAGAVLRLRKRLPEMQIHVHVPDEVLMVPMDPVLISQVLINLMENAYYHSKSEEPIDLFVEKQSEWVEFHIRDYGIGIAPDRLQTIFDGGGMERNSSGDSHKGMGIGLTICRTIILAHDGEVWALNKDKGAEFVFTLPLKQNRTQDIKNKDTKI